MSAIKIASVRGFALTSAVSDGPLSSLGPMPTRNGMLIELKDRDGATGWGEAWCNFPPAGNVAKLALVRDVIAPLLLANDFDCWVAARPALEAALTRMVLHTGEPGPFAHCLAAIDTAMADMEARRRRIPLARLLSDGSAASAQVYASTPNPRLLEDLVPKLCDAGHLAFKLKIGYGAAHDRETLSRFGKIANGSALMVDANQSWEVESGARALSELEEWRPIFIEEPLRADAALGEWLALSRSSTLRLAAGENILGASRFAAHVEIGSLSVVQPDVAKWGGVSGAMEVGRHAAANGAECSLHFMGTALGLAASMHVLAALGGLGRVELDVNDNPLRTELGAIDLRVHDGAVRLPEGDGIGFEPDPEALRRFCVAQCDIHA